MLSESGLAVLPGRNTRFRRLKGDPHPADPAADPMGKGSRAFRRTAEELDVLINRVLGSVFPL
ncbi:MAG: hypothetical protein ACKO5A_01030 [Actinomycetota bacterium]